MGASGYEIAGSEMDFINSWTNSFGKSGGGPIEVIDVRQGWGKMVLGSGLLAALPTVKSRVFGWGLAGHVDSEIILKSEMPLGRIRGFAGIEANDLTLNIKVPTNAERHSCQT